MNRVFGIDVGGTSIKIGLFEEGGELVATEEVPTGALLTEDDFAKVTGALGRVLEQNGAAPEEVCAIGLDIPGPVDAEGRVGMLPNIQLDDKGLRAAIQDSFGAARLAFVNDANAAALGELWQGAARGVGSAVLVALGTGVGAGVIVDGRVVAGAFGAAGEIGHLTVNRSETRVCGCGRCGCLEQYASATGVVRMYRERCEAAGATPAPLTGPTDTLSVFRAAEHGNEVAADVIFSMADYLGYALAQVSCVVDPEVYLIGGGVGKGFGFFGERLRSAFRHYCLATSAGTRIVQASLGNAAAMYGCAYQALLARS